MLRNAKLFLSHSEPSIRIPSEASLEELLFRSVGRFYDQGDDEYAFIQLAFQLAQKAHHGEYREEPGVPYLAHPVETAIILMEEFGAADHKSVILALLHDVPEERPEFSAAFLASFFPPEEACFIVEGLDFFTPPASPASDEAVQEYHRRFSRARPDIAKPKVADRLHNMRTLEHIPDPARQARIVRDTETHYLPLSRTLGVGFAELEREIWKAKRGLVLG